MLAQIRICDIILLTPLKFLLVLQPPSTPNIGRSSEYFRRIASIVGIYLATTACDTPKTSKSYSDSGCRVLIEGNRELIHCFEPPGKARRRRGAPKKISRKAFRRAKSKASERESNEVIALDTYGGHLFDMERLPEMAKECPTVSERGEEGTRAKVYMRFPKLKGRKPRIVIYLHGNGGHNLKHSSGMNVIKFTKEMQEKGDPVILIAPQDGWGNYYPEGPEKKQPGNWRDFNDPDAIANLVSFAEGVVGQHVNDITLSSFSGGNIGIMKILRSLERVKGKNPEAKKLYTSIKRIAFFDSAAGEGRHHVARWMAANPKTKVMSCYNRKNYYEQGNTILRKAIEDEGVSPNRITIEKMKKGQGHGVYEKYYKRYTSR